MTLPETEKSLEKDIKTSIADRRSMIELNSQNWKKNVEKDKSGTKTSLSDRMNALTDAQKWKNKSKTDDYNMLTGNYYELYRYIFR